MIAHKLFEYLVIKYRILTPQYFFDVLQEWEIREYIDTIEYIDIPAWERTRLIMYMTAQVNCSKELKLQDIFKFKWDDNSNKIITNKEIEKLSNMAQKYKEILNGSTT